MEENSSTENLAPNQVPSLQATTPVAPEFWAVGLSGEVAGCGLATGKRAKGKSPTMQVELESQSKWMMSYYGSSKWRRLHWRKPAKEGMQLPGR